jgi:hypothetical protein
MPAVMTVTRPTSILRPQPDLPAMEVIMWTVVTSHGQRVDGITHEHIAFRTVHSMGITTLIAPYRYLVVDHRGQRFQAEIHRAPTPTFWPSHSR